MTGSRLRSEFAAEANSAGLMLWRVTNRWQTTQRAALAPCDLTHVQFVVLAALTHRPAEADDVSQRELADLASIDVMMASQVIRTLERKGLIARRPHPTDKRAQAISVTAAGVDAANDAVVRVERADTEFFATLPGDREQFVEQLRVLAGAGTREISRAGSDRARPAPNAPTPPPHASRPRRAGREP